METRRQGIGLMTAICFLIGGVVVLQLWILSAAVEALLGNRPGVLWPAAIASIVLLGVSGALILFVFRFDRQVARADRVRRP